MYKLYMLNKKPGNYWGNLHIRPDVMRLLENNSRTLPVFFGIVLSFIEVEMFLAVVTNCRQSWQERPRQVISYFSFLVIFSYTKYVREPWDIFTEPLFTFQSHCSLLVTWTEILSTYTVLYCSLKGTELEDKKVVILWNTVKIKLFLFSSTSSSPCMF